MSIDDIEQRQQLQPIKPVQKPILKHPQQQYRLHRQVSVQVHHHRVDDDDEDDIAECSHHYDQQRAPIATVSDICQPEISSS
jgi:hypothetical protein